MITTYRVTSPAGTVLGEFLQGELAAVKALVQANPGSEVTTDVMFTACETHPAYEATNCPCCGTAREIGA